MGHSRSDRARFVVVASAIVLVVGGWLVSRDTEEFPTQTDDEGHSEAHSARELRSPEPVASTSPPVKREVVRVDEVRPENRRGPAFRPRNSARSSSTIRGVVRERETFGVVENADVEVASEKGDVRTSIQTDADGRFELAPIPEETAGSINVYLDGIRTSLPLLPLKPGIVDVPLEVDPRRTFHGIVVDASEGRAIVGATVSLGVPIEHVTAETQTGPRGEFEFRVSTRALAASTYLFARAPGFAQRHLRLEHVSWPIRLELPKATRIEGQVVDERGSPVDSDVCLMGWRPLAEHAQGEPSLLETANDHLEWAIDLSEFGTKASRFAFESVLPHTRYRVRSQIDFGREGGGPRGEVECLTGPSGSTTTVRIVVRERTHVLRGVVVDSDGGSEPRAKDVRVTLLQNDSAREALTDADGAFVFTHLCSGPAWVRAERSGIESSATAQVNLGPGTPPFVSLVLSGRGNRGLVKRVVSVVDRSTTAETSVACSIHWRSEGSNSWEKAVDLGSSWTVASDGTRTANAERDLVEAPPGKVVLVAVEQDHVADRVRLIATASVDFAADDTSPIVLVKSPSQVGILRVEYASAEGDSPGALGRRLFVRSLDPSLWFDGTVVGKYRTMTDRWTEFELPLGEYMVMSGEWWADEPDATHGIVTIGKDAAAKVKVPGTNRLAPTRYW